MCINRKGFTLMKVLFLPTNCSGVMFWRCWQFFNKMKQKGIDTAIYNFRVDQNEVGKWERNFVKDKQIREEVYRLLRYCDIGVIQYIHHPLILAVIMMFQEEYKKKLLAEIDDEIIDTPSYNPAFLGGWKPGNPNEKVIIEHLKVSNGIVTSTQFLGEYYSKFNKKVFVIPNSIDFDKWNIINGNGHKKLRIGWIGGGNHEEDLKILVDVIPIIQKKYKNIEFYFVHGVPNYLKKIKGVKWTLDWETIDKYPEHLASYGFDIGLAPLTINKFNMAKSNLKWLEYSALKIPTVATNIEPYTKSIKHGETGFLCKTVNHWVDNISLLVENENLRKEIGNNANEEIQKNWNLDKVTDKYIKYLRNCL